MLLKSLELYGFKTFPDKTKLSFGNGITAVVGPNGSGKSNISDAIRWVLGEQSTKTLRCSKMEDVVFGGTHTRKSQGFSTVTLTIDNSDRKLPFDDDEVAVSRRYYRSGESEYLINKASVRLKDIHELFMDTGLGRDGYSMISQGKIDSIVASKSEDRREIFEEAAGISRFKYRKIEAQKKLQQAEENLLRLRDILTELQDRVGPLEEQSSKAKEYIKLMEEKRVLEIGIWLDVLNKSGKILKDQESKIAISLSQHKDVEDDIEKIRNQTEEIFLESNSISILIEKARKEISIFEEESSQKSLNASVLENDILHNNESINRIKKEVLDVKNSSVDIDSQIEEKMSKIEKTKLLINENQTLLDKTTFEYQTLKDDLQNFSNTIKDLSNDLSNLSLKASDSKVSQLTLTSTISELELRISNSQTSIENYNTKIIDLEKTISDYNKMGNEAKQISENLLNLVNGYEIKLQNKKQKTVELKKESDSLSLDVEGKIRRIRILEELERNLEGFAQSVKAVMRESRNGVLSGIHGPVSRIIKVNSKYAAAIETALGASMQNIVVDTDSDAKNAISFLKRKDLGRATFLPIATIKGKSIEEKGLKDLDGYVGIASDLCGCDNQYNEIIKSLLGRIVICEDLNCAVNISKTFNYRFRVVTLDGQVVNAGGSLTGGSLSKNSGILSRVSEIEKLNKETQELKIKGNKVLILYNESEEAVSKIEAVLLGSRGDLSKAKEEYINISAECRNYISEMEHSKKLFSDHINENSSTKKRVEDLKKECEVSKKEYNDYSYKIKDIEEKISAITGNKNNLTQNREEVLTNIQELRLLIVTYQKDIESITYEINSMQNSKLNQVGKIQEFQNQILQLENKNKDIQNNIETMKKESDDFKNQAEILKKKIEEHNSKKISLEKRSVELRQLERDKSVDREDIGKELARLEEQKSGIQKEYDLIISKLWEEYELTRKEAESITDKIEDIPKAKRLLNELRIKIKKLGSVNISAIEEYKEVSSRYEFMKKQLDDVEKSKEELLKLTIVLTKQMRELFIEKFNHINEKFLLTFKELFGGGKAEIKLTDPLDMLNSGIEIFVQPPGKIVAHLEALSGGEKALVAIALYFAIMKVSPSPFCVLDEIEAALDEVNVYRYASYLRKMNDNTQFIVITHRRGTMEEADVLYGVTMQDEGVSKLLEINASEIEKKLGIKQLT